MLIPIPRIRRQVTLYFCPRCKTRQRFFSVLPVLTPEWCCRRCQQKFRINAVCLASNWAGVFGLWSMPPALVFGGILAACVLVVSPVQTGNPILMRLVRVLLGLLCGGPMIMVGTAPVFAILGFFVGLVYGAIAVVQRRERDKRASRSERD